MGFLHWLKWLFWPRRRQPKRRAPVRAPPLPLLTLPGPWPERSRRRYAGQMNPSPN